MNARRVRRSVALAWSMSRLLQSGPMADPELQDRDVLAELLREWRSDRGCFHHLRSMAQGWVSLAGYEAVPS